MVYKSSNGLVDRPESLFFKFVKQNEMCYSLRETNCPVCTNLNLIKSNFSYSGAVLWDSRPCDMREAKSSSLFK